MSDDALRSLAVAVLASGFHDLHNRAASIRVPAMRFFADGDYLGWCAVAGIEPDLIARCLQRLEATGARVRAGDGGPTPTSSSEAIGSGSQPCAADEGVSGEDRDAA